MYIIFIKINKLINYGILFMSQLYLFGVEYTCKIKTGIGAGVENCR